MMHCHSGGGVIVVDVLFVFCVGRNSKVWACATIPINGSDGTKTRCRRKSTFNIKRNIGDTSEDCCCGCFVVVCDVLGFVICADSCLQSKVSVVQMRATRRQGRKKVATTKYGAVRRAESFLENANLQCVYICIEIFPTPNLSPFN
jgi:hypothetical protein